MQTAKNTLPVQSMASTFLVCAAVSLMAVNVILLVGLTVVSVHALQEPEGVGKMSDIDITPQKITQFMETLYSTEENVYSVAKYWNIEKPAAHLAQGYYQVGSSNLLWNTSAPTSFVGNKMKYSNGCLMVTSAGNYVIYSNIQYYTDTGSAESDAPLHVTFTRLPDISEREHARASGNVHVQKIYLTGQTQSTVYLKLGATVCVMSYYPHLVVTSSQGSCFGMYLI